jgi:HlyD family secretion protein
MLAGCGDDPDDAIFQGYVEGEFVEVAPEVGGRIVELPVRLGDQAETGDLLLRLDDAEARAAVAQAEAELARAEAQLANLTEGQRPPEIAVIEAEIDEAEASLETAQKELERQHALFAERVISEARLDQAREAVSVAEARRASAERRREVATLPARTPEIEAGERAVEAARAALQQARTRLSKYVVNAPVAGRVEDVHYEVGEVAASGAPVLSLLPADGRKVLFFVPEAARPALEVGQVVSIACDGCPTGITAEISFLGAEAEFTPPIIFSRETRGKLVFRAEAALSGAGARLPLGQPVDVASALRGAQ